MPLGSTKQLLHPGGEIIHFQGHVLVFDNLNARTGQEPASLSTQGDNPLPGGDSIPSPTCSPGTTTTTTKLNASQLLQLHRTLGMYIVNGKLRGHSYGRYNYSSSLGRSTVDYFITDLELESLRAFTQSAH